MESKNSSLLDCINAISFFDEFSQKEKNILLEKVGMFKKFDKKGAQIFAEGEKGNSMFVLLEGVVGITRLSFKLEKEERIILAKLKKGAVFGEISMLSNKKRTTGAMTESSLVIVMVIDKQTLESFELGIQKIFHTQMIATLIRKLEEMNEKYRNLIA